MNKREFDSKELARRFDGNLGSVYFSEALRRSAGIEQSFSLMSQYVGFSRGFAGYVSHLAGRIACSRRFWDGKNDLAPLSDRGCDVAAHVFRAAVDEFCEGKDSSLPHRALARHTIESAATFIGLGESEVRTLAFPSGHTERISEAIAAAYGLRDPRGSDSRLLFNIGAHLASEGTAASEFYALKQFLENEHPELVAHMRSSMLQDISAFHWIEIHSLIEWTHFEHAVMAANLAIRYVRDPDVAISEISEGMSTFEEIQQDFFRNL